MQFSDRSLQVPSVKHVSSIKRLKESEQRQEFLILLCAHHRARVGGVCSSVKIRVHFLARQKKNVSHSAVEKREMSSSYGVSRRNLKQKMNGKRKKENRGK